MNTKFKYYAVNTLRIVLGLVFIFSGLMKAIDPWGTAIKLGEYYSAFGLEWLSGSEMIFSVMMSTLEMSLGFAMLFNIGRRITYSLMLLAMVFFTIVTLILALTNPISDCGCFGDAIKLTNWETFWKNAVLLIFALIVWAAGRQPQPYRGKKMLDISMLGIFLLFSVGVSLYALRYLPPVDFLPFKAGTHIPSTMDTGSGSDFSTILIYKDKATGKEREFSLEETEWQDSTKWEFVDTRFINHGPEKRKAITDFAIFDSRDDKTVQILSDPRVIFMVTMTSPADLDARCRRRLASALDYASQQGYNMISVTSAIMPAGGVVPIGDHMLPMYNIDATTLKSLIRANSGLVVLQEGTVLGKWSCAGIPDFSRKYADGDMAAALTVKNSCNSTLWLAVAFFAGLAVVFGLYNYVGCRKK